MIICDENLARCTLEKLVKTVSSLRQLVRRGPLIPSDAGLHADRARDLALCEAELARRGGKDSGQVLQRMETDASRFREQFATMVAQISGEQAKKAVE